MNPSPRVQIRRRGNRTPKIQIHNQQLAARMRSSYSPADLAELQRFLSRRGCFGFSMIGNGLFPAAAGASAGQSGYRYVWVRDNVHVAHAHYACGKVAIAARTMQTLLAYFQTHRGRFRQAIAQGRPADPMRRPHIRFDGGKLKEVRQNWPHAQNDALGYFLWFYCKLARQGILAADDRAIRCLADFPRFFQAIAYWRDADSGHWEEAQKVCASSIGAALAGLREFELLADEKSLWSHPALARTEVALTRRTLAELQSKGRAALNKILPWESIQPASQRRRYDAALLFLIYPLKIVTPAQAAKILSDVRGHLEGEHGIRRYLGDSYWFPDYKQAFSSASGAADFSGGLAQRDAHVRVGQEAQWCIFDSIISVIYGQRYRALRDSAAAGEMIGLQTHYLNRALGQVTGQPCDAPPMRMPEAYYLCQGRYVPNDNTPLYWAQANLLIALHEMSRSLRQ
jgi:Glycosyl hydrolases family 15